MRHPSTRELFDYWNFRRGRRPAPDRGDIEPSAIRRILADTFILSCDERAGHPFRIAGTRVCAAFGRELKSEPFDALWTPAARVEIRDLVRIVTTEMVGILVNANATSSARTAHDVELLLLPLSHRGNTGARVLGALVPRDAPYWLGACTLGPLAIGGLRYLGGGLDRTPLPAQERPQGRVRHGLIVYDGGRL